MNNEEYLQSVYDLAKAVWTEGGSRNANSIVGKISNMLVYKMVLATDGYKAIANAGIEPLVALLNAKEDYALTVEEHRLLDGMLAMLNH